MYLFLHWLQITTEKLDELKENIPKAGPKYRLGMYFETIHNLPCFDDVTHHEDGGYTSYWETDTEVDSDFGNFIFNNVSGDSASLICIDETIDLLALHKRREQIISESKPHYKLEQCSSVAKSPSPDSPLERSFDSKRSSHSQHSKRSRNSGSDGIFNIPPPVPPPRRPTITTDFQDHTYETLDDCKEDYLAHQDAIYISKGSEDSRGSQDSTAKPVINGIEAESDRSSNSKGAGGAAVKSSPVYSKLRTFSSKSPELGDSLNYRQNRKMSDPSSVAGRKRRSEKVASKGCNYPPPIKGFPAGMPSDYVDYTTASLHPCCQERSQQQHTSASPTASPCQRGCTVSPETRTRNGFDNQKMAGKKRAPPLIIKHKGKTYMVPVVDAKLQKELEKRSKLDNPSVLIKEGNVYRSYSFTHTQRSYASPPQMEPCEHALSHKNRRNSTKSTAQKTTKQVTHYGIL